MSGTSNLQLHETFFYFLHRHQTFQHLKQIHSLVITSGFSEHSFLLNKLLHCFTLSHNSRHLHHALLLFDQILTPNTSLWNTIIKAFSTSSQSQMSITYFARMRRNDVFPNNHTYLLLLKAFSMSKCKKQNPFQIYANIIKFGFDSDPFVGNSLISSLANCGYTKSARKLFDYSTVKDVVSWTAMMNGYVKNGFGVEGLQCFMEMRSMDVRIDEKSIVSVLGAVGMVGDIWFGRWIHGFYIERGRVKVDVYVQSVLVDMYSKCGYCDDALKIFNEMPNRNVVSWSTMIAGYVQCNRFKDALLVFQHMLEEDVKPNESTLTSVLTACAQLGAFDQGRWIHGYINRNIELDMKSIELLGTALIDMYSKCGWVEEALMVFDNLPRKNVYAWTAMMNGLAMHGDVLSSLNLFRRMVRIGVQPNEVTFIGVLSACSHAGLVDEGWKLFKSMRREYGVEPNVNHYGCMVDILGRAGYIEEAMKLIEGMPMEPTPGVWGALLGSCVIHKALELGSYVGNHLIKLQPDHSGRYTLLANLYSKCRRWDTSAYVRKLMKNKGVEKATGFSWIQVNGGVHEFISVDRSHSEYNNIYRMLDFIYVQLKLPGYVADVKLLALNMEGGS